MPDISIDTGEKLMVDGRIVILLYILVQRTQANDAFLEELARHPRYGEEPVRRLARFALTVEPFVFS